MFSFFKENRTVYDIVWESMVESDRPQILYMRHIIYGACALRAR